MSVLIDLSTRGARWISRLLAMCFLTCAWMPLAAATVTIYPIPQEVASSRFTVTIDGWRTPVVHAAGHYYLLNFDVSGPAKVTVTSSDPHYWDRGVEVQPMRFGIRPRRHGATIEFPITGPQKLAISRPGDHFGGAEMLFLFANEPDTSHIGPDTPNVRYYGPGVHQGSIDAHSGDTIYLAGGAVIFGGLNIWQVHDVRVLGRGMFVYDGPQNPNADEGWMHKPGWHAIVMDNARNIEIDGITTVVRSRTWQIQMRDSRHIGFNNIKVVAGTPGDANQDGIDWLGGGDTTIHNSFFRASDDVFALYGNWDGYSQEAMLTPGHDVSNITIDTTTVSTSISNIIRVGWPQKIFNSAHFHMSDMDVMHAGYGDCKVPFAFFELWDDPGGRGTHTDYSFDAIRMEDWYSLFQIDKPLPSVTDIAFRGVWAMDAPGMVPSTLNGRVSEVSLRGVPVNPVEEVRIENGASAPAVLPAILDAGFSYSKGLLKPGQKIRFTAAAPAAAGRQFHWIFGDGTAADGREVLHSFADREGTLLDGSGRFRVLLRVTQGGDSADPTGREAWGSQPAVIAHRALAVAAVLPAAATAYQRTFRVPAEGGYTFTLLTGERMRLSLDGAPGVDSPAYRKNVCGSPGGVIQPVQLSAELTAGLHTLRLEPAAGEDATVAADAPVLLWQGPDLPLQAVPEDAAGPR